MHTTGLLHVCIGKIRQQHTIQSGMMLQIYTCKRLKQQGEHGIYALRALVINEVPTVNIECNLLPVPP